MKLKLLVTVVLIFGCFAVAVVYSTTASLDGVNPPHAVDTDGKTVPESSATQPDKPIILSKDIHDDKYGELKPEAALDHTKHNTDVMHTLDGKTLTACVYCHHTEQPMPVAGQPYLKKSERSEVLTSAQLETSKQAVNSCRKCHFQEASEEHNTLGPVAQKHTQNLLVLQGQIDCQLYFKKKRRPGPSSLAHPSLSTHGTSSKIAPLHSRQSPTP